MIESLTPSEIVIRPASGQSDAAQIARIYNHYVDVGGATFDKVHWPVERVEKLLEIGLPDGCYVADLNGHLLGWASARQFSDRAGFRFSCETAIYLDADAVGKKIADPLQQAIDLHCRENGIHHAVAKVIASNQRSMAFHYRSGYELVGIQKEIGHVNGQWEDVAILQKIYNNS